MIFHNIETLFEKVNILKAKEILSNYKGSEKSRVVNAILKLAQGSIDGVKYYLECAQKDYRDVLYWAEYPDEAKESYKNYINSMTVNERLYHLNLFDEFDSAILKKNEKKLKSILKKCLLSESNINEIVKSKIKSNEGT